MDRMLRPEDLAQLLRLLRTQHPKRQELWKDLVNGLKTIPPEEVGRVWCSCVEDLAISPPPLPIRAQVDENRWNEMVMAQVHELFDLALREAGIKGGVDYAAPNDVPSPETSPPKEEADASDNEDSGDEKAVEGVDLKAVFASFQKTMSEIDGKLDEVASIRDIKPKIGQLIDVIDDLTSMRSKLEDLHTQNDDTNLHLSTQIGKIGDFVQQNNTSLASKIQATADNQFAKIRDTLLNDHPMASLDDMAKSLESMTKTLKDNNEQLTDLKKTIETQAKKERGRPRRSSSLNVRQRAQWDVWKLITMERQTIAGNKDWICIIPDNTVEGTANQTWSMRNMIIWFARRARFARPFEGLFKRTAKEVVESGSPEEQFLDYFVVHRGSFWFVNKDVISELLKTENFATEELKEAVTEIAKEINSLKLFPASLFVLFFEHYLAARKDYFLAQKDWPDKWNREKWRTAGQPMLMRYDPWPFQPIENEMVHFQAAIKDITLDKDMANRLFDYEVRLRASKDTDKIRLDLIGSAMTIPNPSIGSSFLSSQSEYPSESEAHLYDLSSLG